MYELRPLNDKVVVRPKPAEEQTAAGLLLPENAKEKPVQGTVVSVGPGKANDKGIRLALDLSVGDKVLYNKYSGNEFNNGVEDLLILDEGDILVTLKEVI